MQIYRNKYFARKCRYLSWFSCFSKCNISWSKAIFRNRHNHEYTRERDMIFLLFISMGKMKWIASLLPTTRDSWNSVAEIEGKKAEIRYKYEAAILSCYWCISRVKRIVSATFSSLMWWWGLSNHSHKKRIFTINLSTGTDLVINYDLVMYNQNKYK